MLRARSVARAEPRALWCSATKTDPPVRIDYIFTDGKPQTAALLNRNTSAGTPFSDHLGIEVRA